MYNLDNVGQFLEYLLPVLFLLSDRRHDEELDAIMYVVATKFVQVNRMSFLLCPLI